MVPYAVNRDVRLWLRFLHGLHELLLVSGTGSHRSRFAVAGREARCTAYCDLVSHDLLGTPLGGLVVPGYSGVPAVMAELAEKNATGFTAGHAATGDCRARLHPASPRIPVGLSAKSHHSAKRF